jgi:rSAM/selenodomain-associated transferase 1
VSRSCIVVLAKAPMAGYAKTRLIPALGSEGAAKLADRLLNHAVSQATGAGADAVVLCAAPDRLHPAFQRLQREQHVQLTEQGSGDLGARMHRAFQHAFVMYDRVLLMGTDAPALSSSLLHQALQILDALPPSEASSTARAHEAVDAVFVPALDGGYALVGLRQECLALFLDMPWSTPQVMAITRQRAKESGLRFTELPAVADIDEPQDLVHLPAGWMACKAAS